MSNNLTVIMYHYVRDLKNSRYPMIKGCDIGLFKEQIKYLKKYYNFVTVEEVINAYWDGNPLPNKACLLTFDDAYKDHFDYVFPFLEQEKIQGAFYPPVRAITEHTVLDVNKIHFILASTPIEGMDKLLNEIICQLDIYRDEFSLMPFDFYYDKLAVANRFDTQDIVFVKRLLQVELAETVRKLITNNLFTKIVGADEDVFSRELYMSIDQIKCMRDFGMHIGSHGYDHYWFSSLSIEKQQFEITKSIDFIRDIGGDYKNWTICYPYGDFNNDTIRLLKQYGCKMGLCTKVDIAHIDKSNDDIIYKIPRLDVNDIPKDSNAVPNKWYVLG